MTTPHSPLPPTMPVSLETMSAKLDHAVLVIELMAGQVRRIDDARVETERVERSMRSIALRLTKTAMTMSAARVAAAIAPTGRAVLVTVAGSFAGGFVGSLLWQFWHAGSALASP
jgi:hypothetical protein